MVLASLFLESAYSFNGSNILIDSLVKRAKDAGYQALVLTDKKMHGVYQFYQACKHHNLGAVIGLQVKLEPILNGSFIRVVCYAQNDKGYRNLLKLASLQSFNETLPMAFFKKYQDGITTVVTLHDGEVASTLDSAQNFNLLLAEVDAVTSALVVGEHAGFNCPKHRYSVVQYDYVRYMDARDSDVFEGLKQIFQMESETPFTEMIPSYFKPVEELRRFSKDQQQGIHDFIEAHRLDLTIEPPALPTYPHTQGLGSQGFLQALSRKGLMKRLKGDTKHQKVYEERLQYELKTIHSLGYDDYFLIVWDVIKFAKKAGYLVGPGRGSAPGSLVAYVLGITDVDPIRFDLLFERFLNKARQSMPDIDIDFPDHAREAVIKYTQETFQKENVAYICTFGTFLKRSALRETARQFSVESKYVDEMVKCSEAYVSIEAMIETDLDVKNRMKTHDQLKRWLRIAASVEGLPKHVGTHAAGIVISSRPIIEYSAIQEGLQGGYQTQYEQRDLESIGLLKMDFLGLRNLSMIETIVDDIEKAENIRLNMYQLPLDDQKTFKLLREKSTTGIFQLESRGMRQLIKDMQIRCFEDIAVILALFRPGPMESIPTYLRRRFKKEKVTFVSEKVKPILKPTEGILLYQEQIMAIASAFANYSMSEADLLRRAVSKKDADSLQAERQRFVRKSLEANQSEKMADAIYDYIVKFANYGFNKSHSVAYALISYWMAYLKANYPAYFIGVLMQSALSNERVMREHMQEAAQLGLEVKPPCVNVSGSRFVLEKAGLYYPLIGIKNIGKNVYKVIETARRDGRFKSFVDFVVRTYKDVNKRSYQYLIYAGACDVFGENKQTMLENVEAIQHFADYQGDVGLDEFVFTVYEEFDAATLKQFEGEALGFNMVHDDLKPYVKLVRDKGYYWVSDLVDVSLNKTVQVLAFIGRMQVIKTKNNDAMAFLTIEDNRESIECVCFPNVYQRDKAALEPEAVLLFTGKVSLKGQRRQFIVEAMKTV